MAVKEMLIGCNSEATSHCTLDYPYGFKLRCQRREWLEYKPNHGYRFVTQTSNPKKPSKWVVCDTCNGSGYIMLAVLGHPGRQTVCVCCNGNGQVEELVWNAPKASTYVTLAAMYIDEQGHVQWAGLHMYSTVAEIDAFVSTYREGLSEDAGKIAGFMRAVAEEIESRRAKFIIQPSEPVRVL